MGPNETLTDRDFEFFHLFATGRKMAEVARALRLSPKTVHTHRRGILRKLNLKSNADVVRYAFEHKRLASLCTISEAARGVASPEMDDVTGAQQRRHHTPHRFESTAMNKNRPSEPSSRSRS